MSTSSLIPFSDVTTWCAEQGLHALAVIDNPGALDPNSLDTMLSDGVGDMQWLDNHRELRLQPDRFFPGLQRIVCVAMPYQPELPEEQNLKRARYAAGKDYHNVLRKKLIAVAKNIKDENGEPYLSRAAVDSAPLSERQIAEQAGLGWLGKMR